MFSWVIQTTETEREKVSEMTSLQVGHFNAPGDRLQEAIRQQEEKGQGKVWIHGEDMCENSMLESTHCPGHNTHSSLFPVTN